MEWWSGGVVEGWSGGVVEWWSGSGVEPASSSEGKYCDIAWGWGPVSRELQPTPDSLRPGMSLGCGLTQSGCNGGLWAAEALFALVGPVRA